MPSMTAGEKTAGRTASIRAYTALDIITNGVPARARCRNGIRSASARVVTVSVTPPRVSVLAVTRPSPGKCLTVGTTPASAIPAANAPARAATDSGIDPNCRS
jgi:hypothetical protein